MTDAAKSAGLWQPQDADLEAVPVRRARGASPGPHLLVTGGVHGDEYEGPVAIERFFAALDPARLAGTLTLLPVLNVAAWRARRRCTPADGADLNRAFPGDPAGGPTPRLAAALFETFVRPADAVIDLHSGGIALRHLPMAGVPEGAPPLAVALQRAFDRRFRAWRMPLAPGVFSGEAQRAGKAAVGVEWGGGGALDEQGVAALLDALARALRAMSMGDGGFSPPPPDPDNTPPLAGDYQASGACGVWTPRVRLGAAVRAGDALGALTDPLSGGTACVRAARAGQVAGLAHLGWVEAADRVAYVG